MHRYRSHRVRLVAAGIVAGLLVFPALEARGQGGDRRWEIEGYGGAATSLLSGEGNAMLPPAGAPIATSSPIFPSRRVPSWFFGDGALLLNQVNRQFAVAALIQPLDAVLGNSGVDLDGRFAAGARLRRRLTSRFSVEASFDLFPAAVKLSDALLEGAQAASASFVPAFEGLLGSGPFTDVAVSSTTTDGGSGAEIALTGALVYRLSDSAAWTPYLTFGGGVITGSGGASLELQGQYRFRVLGEVPIDETDRLSVRNQGRTVPAGVVGAGLRRAFSDRWVFRLDGRVLIAAHTTELLIDAAPAIAPGTPADFVESFSTPSVQFSNDPASGRESSLGGPGLDGFRALTVTGLRARVVIAAGLSMRF